MLLQEQGHNILEASDPHEAEYLANREAPDLVILDIALQQGLTGFDAARLLRAKNPNLPILFISGLEPHEIRETITGAEFLKKPFSAKKFRAAVDSLLAKTNG